MSGAIYSPTISAQLSASLRGALIFWTWIALLVGPLNALTTAHWMVVWVPVILGLAMGLSLVEERRHCHDLLANFNYWIANFVNCHLCFPLFHFISLVSWALFSLLILVQFHRCPLPICHSDCGGESGKSQQSGNTNQQQLKSISGDYCKLQTAEQTNDLSVSLGV